ncbi:hypothetical protein HZH68_003651 [Vespula germanica]|uniref:Uncharacterized protein n=1 Tax=Vespula germanica TaxID=30212 RepID=A0A834NPN5_VESGE|nr:hypothetical protein HZH68_003651 [Vespula germanica]
MFADVSRRTTCLRKGNATPVLFITKVRGLREIIFSIVPQNEFNYRSATTKTRFFVILSFVLDDDDSGSNSSSDNNSSNTNNSSGT